MLYMFFLYRPSLNTALIRLADGTGGLFRSMDSLRPGDPDIVGGYRLLGRLGAGGMGQVYLGESPGGRKVAVKLIHPPHAETAQFRERFTREIKAAQRVGGFHTAPVVDANPGADPPWMVTAYIDGPSLQDAVDRDGPLAPDRVRALGAGLAEGLAAIHACGLVHRDLKPANVILAADGPRIIDFGIARAVDVTTGLTTTGSLVGTFAYMSPEQIRGELAGPASDVFALGCVLTFASTGQPPFGGDSAAALMFRIVSQPPDLADLADTGLRGLITGCLAKSPQDRPGVAAVLATLTSSRPTPRDNGATPRGAAEIAVAVDTARQASALALTETGSPHEHLSFPSTVSGQGQLSDGHDAGDRTPRAARSRHVDRPVWRRPLSIVTAVATVVACLTIVIINVFGARSAPPGHDTASLGAPGDLVAMDHNSDATAGYNGAIHVDFTLPQSNLAHLSSVQYGINGTSVSGSWSGPGSPGSRVDKTINGLTNGIRYVVYLRGCSNIGQCGSWVGPSNQVVPYGKPAAPTVSAKASGASIKYSWGGGGHNGRPVRTYNVCIDASCFETGAGSTTKPSGRDQTHTITVYVVDSVGEQSASVSDSATTVATVATVTVQRGINEAGSSSTVGLCAGRSKCINFYVSVSGFPANTALTYTCADSSGVWWSASKGWNGSQVRTDSNGSASFYTQCLHYPDGSSITISASGGSTNQSGTYSG